MLKPWHHGAGVLVAAAALSFAGCRRAPQRVTAQDLFMRREKWLGRRVVVDGVLERFSPSEGEYFAIEDAGFRVGLKGGDPAVLREDVGRRVTAEGEFGFGDGYGAYVELERLESAP